VIIRFRKKIDRSGHTHFACAPCFWNPFSSNRGLKAFVAMYTGALRPLLRGGL
jgi:hypothetical protein